MLRRLRSLAAERRGVATIEFATVGLAFFLMLFGIFELGRMASAESALTYGTDVATRYAAVHGSASASPASATTVADQFTSAVSPVLGGAAPAPTVTFSPDNNPGSTVTVSASYDWSPLSMGSSFPSVTLSAQSSLVIQH